MKQKNKIYVFLFLTILVLFLGSKKSEAAINSQLNYQGKLTDDNDVAVADGNYNMILTLYDAASGGSCVWTARGTCGTPTARSVAVANGIFSIMLGDTGAGDNALTGLDFNSTYYLGITVGADAEMIPRKILGAAPYAFNASMLGGLASATSGADAHILATDSSGNATISGNTYFNGTTYYINSSGTGNLNGLTLAGDIAVNGNDITSTGALAFTPAAGSGFNVSLSTTGDFAVNTNHLFVDTSAGFVGIGTAAPGSALDVKGTLRLSGATSGYVGFAPASDAGSTTYTLPSSDGTSGQVLKTNGSGILSWGEAGAALTPWTENVNAAGYTLYGNSTASGNLTLESTSDSTKGYVLLNPNGGNVGIGVASPSARLAIAAGTATAGTAPLKFASGTNLATPEAGAVEYNGTQLFFSPSTTRNIVAQVSGSTALTSGYVPFATSNGYLTGSSNFFWDSGNNRLGIGNSSPSVSLHVGTTAPTNLGSTANSLMVSGGLEVAGYAYLGPMEFPTNAGAITWIDMPVSSGATAGTVESYTAKLGTTSILTVYGTAAGSGGGITSGSGRIGIGDTTPAALLTVGSGDLFQVNSSGAIAAVTGFTETSTATTAAAATITANSLTSGSILSLASASVTAAAGNTGLNIAISGANLTEAITRYGLQSAVTATNATSGTNVAGYFSASGATTANYGLLVAAGNVGIGMTNPTYTLHVTGTGGFTTSANSPIFQGISAATTFGNASYGTTVAGSSLTISPTAWTATPTISGLITATGGLTANGALTANNTFTLGDNGDTGSVNTSDWDISTAGAMTGIGAITMDGLLTGTAGATLSGAAISLNASSNYAVSIGTGTSTGAVSIGGGSNTVAVDSSDWDISTTGVMTGISGITSDGAYTQSGTSANTFTGTSTFSNSTYSALFTGGPVGIGMTGPTALLHITGTAGTVSLEINSNESTASNNILMLRSDVASGDDPIFRVQADGAVYADGSYTGTGADYAEYFYTEDSDLGHGEVVCVDTEKENAVKRCRKSGDNNVMGIISTSPSMIGNGGIEKEKNPNYKIIGMMGQVPGLVSAENGPIKIGDSLTSAGISGYMRKAETGESTVGVALENFSGERGKIQILISRRNQSLTVERIEQAVSENMSEMGIEKEIERLFGQTDDFSSQISDISLQTNSVSAEILSIKNMQEKLTSQMSLIEAQAGAASDFIVNLDVKNIVYKNAAGNINLLGGKIMAQDIEVENGIKAKNIEAENNLKSNNIELGSDVSGSGKIKAGEKISDPILTKAVGENARIYITPKGSTGGRSLYYDEEDIEEGESFMVKIDSPVSENDIEFNWLIIK